MINDVLAQLRVIGDYREIPEIVLPNIPRIAKVLGGPVARRSWDHINQIRLTNMAYSEHAPYPPEQHHKTGRPGLCGRLYIGSVRPHDIGFLTQILATVGIRTIGGVLLPDERLRLGCCLQVDDYPNLVVLWRLAGGDPQLA